MANEYFNAYISMLEMSRTPVKPIANTCSIGYPHNCLADNAAYCHDCRAGKHRYWHDHRADSSASTYILPTINC